MPDPVLFAKAVAVSGVVSALIVALITLLRRPAISTRINVASLWGITLGAAIGFGLLGLVPHWPPADGFDRFLFIVLPAVVIVELVSGFARVPHLAAWVLRVVLAAFAGRVLLHGSSYLDGSASDWTIGRTWIALVLCAALLITVWSLLAWLMQRSPGISIPLAVSQTCLASGMALMLSASLSGGKTALPLAAGLAGAAITSWLVASRTAGSRAVASGALGVGLISVFGVLILGRFFGELSTGRAVVIFLAPLLCWTTELRALRDRRPWVIAAIRLALVSLPLAAVLFLAQRDFERNSAASGGNETAAAYPSC